MASDANNNAHTIHDTLELDPADGQQYIEELRDKLIELLLPAQNIEEIEERLRKLYPESKLVDLAIREVGKSRVEATKPHKTRHHSTSSSASFTGALHNITSLAMAKVSNLVRDGVIGSKSENEVSKFKMNLIEFIIGDVLNLAGDFVRRQKGNFIISRSDIRTAMHADKDLLDMFLSDDKSHFITENHPILAQIQMTTSAATSSSASTNTSTLDKTFAHHHHHHVHHHHHSQSHPHHHSINTQSITYKQKVRYMVDSENTFIRGLKLIIKVFKAQLEVLPHIRHEVEVIFCNIEELLELSTSLLTALEDALESVGQETEVPHVGCGIYDLAVDEAFDAYATFAYRRLSRNQYWRKAYLNIITNESTMTSIRTAGHSFDLAVKYLLPNYLLNTIIQFFEYFKNVCDLYELSRHHNNENDTFALKETISIWLKTKKAIEEILASEMDHIEIEPLDPKQAESIRTNLERQLDVVLQHERNLPLPYMPPPEIYRFSEPDSKDNIQFIDFQNNRTISSKDIDRHIRNETDQIPVIKCATLIKLVERLTYHKYQPNIVDSFLTTYRSFISDPEELLDLLIERFKIPDPPLSIVIPNYYGPLEELSDADRNAYKQYLRRFRQEYSKPVKMRVLNVLKSWIKNHYYDFERHPNLLDKLHRFLEEVRQNDKVLSSLLESIKKSIASKKLCQRDDFEFMLPKEPPAILWHTARPNGPEPFDILTLHPLEFARQLTLIEFDLFRAIRPDELINVRDLGLRTRKDDKYKASVNLSRMTRHFTLFSYWVRKCIVEADDFDKRQAIFYRAVEIMAVLRDLNNFTGLLSIGSAIESAPIARLSHTCRVLNHNLLKVLDDYRELNKDHQKKLESELKHCNPPCIPYIGSYQTKLIHAKEGNKTFIDEVDTTTISPTLSNDEFHSSFSNSPTTPISPRTPLPPRSSAASLTLSTASTATTITNLPTSATPTLQNQFFGGSVPYVSSRSFANYMHNSGYMNNNNSNNDNHHNNGMNGMSNNSGNISGLVSYSADTMLSHYNSGSVTPVPPQTQHMHPIHYHQRSQTLQRTPSTTAPAAPKMINFTKQRIRADLVAEISSYQNPPYCLKVQPEIRSYIESLETEMVKFALSLDQKDRHESDLAVECSVPALTKRLDDYLFEQSERIEPKNCTKPPRSKSKFPDKSWKSPGIKVNHCTTPK